MAAIFDTFVTTSVACTAGAGLLALIGGRRVRGLVHAVLIAGTGAGAVAAVALLGRDATAWASIGSLTLTPPAAPFYAIVNAIGLLASVYGISYGARHAGTYDLRLLDALFSFFLFGMQGVLLASTPTLFLLFWEVMSVASFFLVMADRSAESVRAALFYFVMTHLGAGALLAAFAIVSGGDLSATFAQVAGTAASLPPSLSLVALGLFLFGFGSKAGIWPVHAWLPEAHPQAPSHVSALMSGVMLKVAVFGFIRVAFGILPGMPTAWAMTIVVLGLVSAVYGALYAAVEHDLKRVLAYSSVENIGIIFVMLGTSLLASSEGMRPLADAALAAAILHVTVHAFFKAGLFMAAGAVIDQTHMRSMEGMGGLARRMGGVSVAACLLALTSAALPPFGAFFGEWLFLNHIVSAVASAPAPVIGILAATLAVMALVGGLATFAMVRMFSIVFLAEPRSDAAAHALPPPALLTVPVWIAAGIATAFGVFAPWLMRAIGFAPHEARGWPAIMLTGAGGTLMPIALLAACAAAVVASIALRRILGARARMRTYRTWDCGQPTTSGMVYTGTAFAGPIRFIFSPILRTRTQLTAEPVVASNPWIVRRTYRLEIGNAWYDWLYAPVARAVLVVSTAVRRLQNGVIQSYIALILGALIVTLVLSV